MDLAQQRPPRRLLKWLIPARSGSPLGGCLHERPAVHRAVRHHPDDLDSDVHHPVCELDRILRPKPVFLLGIAAFFGVGIYTYTLLADALPWAPFPLLLFAAGIGSSILAFFVGLTTLRIKGMYFAIFTFGLSELLRHFVMWWEVNMTGTVGRWIAIVEDLVVYRYMAVLAIITVLAAYLLRRSRYGLALRSIGDAESASEHVGVNASAVKIAVFAASCFFTGAARRAHRHSLDLYRRGLCFRSDSQHVHNHDVPVRRHGYPCRTDSRSCGNWHDLRCHSGEAPPSQPASLGTLARGGCPLHPTGLGRVIHEHEMVRPSEGASMMAERVPLLNGDHVTRMFGGLAAVSDVSFCLFEGEILGLIGPNGAGKTTLFNLISGAMPVSKGSFLFKGERDYPYEHFPSLSPRHCPGHFRPGNCSPA